MGLAMKSGMLSIATSSSRNGARKRRLAQVEATEPAAEAAESSEKARHLKSVDSEEGEGESADAEIEMGANGASSIDVAGLPIEAGPESEAPVPAAPAASAGLESGPTDYSTIGAYLHELRRYPLMTREEEHDVAVQYSKTAEQRLAARLVTANLRLVVKIAQEYRRAHRNILDLIQEGNIGLIHAVQKYDPYRGVKLSSYASWWIRAYILKFILANWRLVKVGTTQAQRKLFFNLRKEREKLEKQGFEVEAKHLAAALDVTEQEVIEMERRLNASETSLDAPMRSDEQGDRTQGDFVRAAPASRPDLQVEAGEFGAILRDKLHAFGATLRDRDLEIFRDRLLNDEPATLVQIAERFGVTRERVRQIEERLKKRLRQYLMTELGDGVQIDDALD
ncbi:MAG TPA: RNA polymerase factor sigma-32 [Polyangia bacterium]|jgi:RNA polymerase sigma-32 factor